MYLLISIPINQFERKIVMLYQILRTDKPIQFHQIKGQVDLAHVEAVGEEVVEADGQRIISVVEDTVEVVDDALAGEVHVAPVGELVEFFYGAFVHSHFYKRCFNSIQKLLILDRIELPCPYQRINAFIRPLFIIHFLRFLLFLPLTFCLFEFFGKFGIQAASQLCNIILILLCAQKASQTLSCHALEKVLDKLRHFTRKLDLRKFLETDLLAFKSLMLVLPKQPKCRRSAILLFHAGLSSRESRVMVAEGDSCRPHQHTRLSHRLSCGYRPGKPLHGIILKLVFAPFGLVTVDLENAFDFFFDAVADFEHLGLLNDDFAFVHFVYFLFFRFWFIMVE